MRASIYSVCSGAIVVLAWSCATAASAQTSAGQPGLRARLPFSGADQPASPQRAMKSEPRASTSIYRGRRSSMGWGYGPAGMAPFYQSRAPWLMPASVPAGMRDEGYSWLDNWEDHRSAEAYADPASLDVVLPPNMSPWLGDEFQMQRGAAPMTNQMTSPTAPMSPLAADPSPASVSETPEPSRNLSAPSAATSSPIPY